MTVLITVSDDGTPRQIVLEGRLTHEELDELRQLVGADPGAVCLQLSGLLGADSAALTELRSLRAEGFELRGVPPHLAWRLDEGERSV